MPSAAGHAGLQMSYALQSARLEMLVPSTARPCHVPSLRGHLQPDDLLLRLEVENGYL